MFKKPYSKSNCHFWKAVDVFSMNKLVLGIEDTCTLYEKPGFESVKLKGFSRNLLHKVQLFYV